MDLSTNETPVIIPSQKQNFPLRNFLLGFLVLILIIISFDIGVFLAPKIRKQNSPPPQIFTAKLLFGKIQEIERKNLLLEEQKERYWISLREPLKVVIVKTKTNTAEIESLADIATNTGKVQTEENSKGVFEDIKIGDFIFVGDLFFDKNADHLLSGSLVRIIRTQ